MQLRSAADLESVRFHIYSLTNACLFLKKWIKLKVADMSYFLKCVTIIQLLIMSSACAQISPSASIQVSSPSEGEKLYKGNTFEVYAAIDVNYDVAFVEIELWDVFSDYQKIWHVEHPVGSKSFILNEILDVPVEAPLGDDYRFMVTVYQVHLLAKEPTTGLGYSLQVEVCEANS